MDILIPGRLSYFLFIHVQCHNPSIKNVYICTNSSGNITKLKSRVCQENELPTTAAKSELQTVPDTRNTQRNNYTCKVNNIR